MVPRIKNHSSYSSVRSVNKRLILIIEDEPFQVEIYEKVIKEAGFKVESLMCGKGALERLEEIKAKKKERPDLILLDIVLPDVDGLDILEKAKSDPEIKDIPVFIFTNYSSPGLEKTIKGLGAEGHVNKTHITPSQLVKIIKDWFKRLDKVS